MRGGRETVEIVLYPSRWLVVGWRPDLNDVQTVYPSRRLCEVASSFFCKPQNFLYILHPVSGFNLDSFPRQYFSVFFFSNIAAIPPGLNLVGAFFASPRRGRAASQFAPGQHTTPPDRQPVASIEARERCSDCAPRWRSMGPREQYSRAKLFLARPFAFFRLVSVCPISLSSLSGDASLPA